MKSAGKKFLKAVVLVTPFVLGVISFQKQFDGPLLSSVYRSIKLYFFDFESDYFKVSPMLELARWTAPVMTATALLTVLSSLSNKLRGFYHVLKKDAIALYGDSRYIDMLSDSLGSRGLRFPGGLNRRADAHILIFNNDAEMLECIQNSNNDLLNDKNRLFICSDSLTRANYRNKNVTLCNFSENCARKYWKDHPLSVSGQERHIVLIGFDRYGQELLSQALLRNVFSAEGGLRYDVFGDASQYCAIHQQLAQIVEIGKETPGRDSIFFHADSWEAHGDILSQADRVIIAGDAEEENIQVLNALSRYYVVGKVYIRSSSPHALRDLWNVDKGEVTVFGTDEELCTLENIMDETTLNAAKRIHATYFSQYACRSRGADCEGNAKTCINCETMLENWRSLSTFTRYSNIMQADHIPVKMAVLLGDGYAGLPDPSACAKARLDSLTEEEQKNLEKIEHIRWMRYHYMNNWRYAPQRDNAARRHPLLVPYERLSPENGRKDLDTWYLAAEIYGDL